MGNRQDLCNNRTNHKSYRIHKMIKKDYRITSLETYQNDLRLKCLNNFSRKTFIKSIVRKLPGIYLQNEKGQLSSVIHSFEVVFLNHTPRQFSLANLLYIVIAVAKSALGHMTGRLQNNLKQLQKRDQHSPICSTSGIIGKKNKKIKKSSVDKIVE